MKALNDFLFDKFSNRIDDIHSCKTFICLLLLILEQLTAHLFSKYSFFQSPIDYLSSL